MKIEEGVALSRFTTLGTGGPAAAFARPESVEELEEALAWARERELAGGDGRARARTCSSPTRASTGLVLKLGGELAEAAVEGERLLAGGGAANAVCLHRVRAAGLGGFEFACAIPGTIGGGVWMNAGRLRQRLGRRSSTARSSSTSDGRTLADAGGARAQLPALGAAPRPGRRARRVHARAAAGGADQGERRAAPGAAQGRAADEQAHVRERLQEPRARAERGPDARGLRAEGPPDRRRADLAASRELHRERGRSTDGRRDRADGRGAAARARAVRRRARARGRVPRPARAPAARGRSARPPRRKPPVPERRLSASASPRRRRPACRRPRARADPARSFRAGARCCRLRDRGRRRRALRARALRRRCSRSTADRGRRARHRAVAAHVRAALARSRVRACSSLDSSRGRAAARRASRRRGLHGYDRRLPAHPPRDRPARAPRRRCPARSEGLARRGEHAGDRAAAARHATRAPADLARALRRARGRGDDHRPFRPPRGAGAGSARGSRTSAAASGWCACASATSRSCSAPGSSSGWATLRAIRLKLAIAHAHPPGTARAGRLLRTST